MSHHFAISATLLDVLHSARFTNITRITPVTNTTPDFGVIGVTGLPEDLASAISAIERIVKTLLDEHVSAIVSGNLSRMTIIAFIDKEPFIRLISARAGLPFVLDCSKNGICYLSIYLDINNTRQALSVKRAVYETLFGLLLEGRAQRTA